MLFFRTGDGKRKLQDIVRRSVTDSVRSDVRIARLNDQVGNSLDRLFFIECRIRAAAQFVRDAVVPEIVRCVFRIRPALLGHRAVDRRRERHISEICLDLRGIEGDHDRAADVDILDVFGIDSDITVAVRPRVVRADGFIARLCFRDLLIDVRRRRSIRKLHFLGVADDDAHLLLRRYDLVLNVLDLGGAQEEQVVSLVADEVVVIEVVVVGRARLVGAGAHGNALRAHSVHKFDRAVFHAEVGAAVFGVNPLIRFRRRDQLAVRVIVHRGNAEGEVVDRFRVYPVDSDVENVSALIQLARAAAGAGGEVGSLLHAYSLDVLKRQFALFFHHFLEIFAALGRTDVVFDVGSGHPGARKDILDVFL